MTLRRLLFGITLVSLFVLTTTIDTQARDQSEFQRSQYASISTDNLIENEQVRGTSKRLRTHVHAIKLSKSELEKLVKSAARCGCNSATTGLGSWTSCFTGCLQSSGVSPASAAACAAVCAANPVGCAICAGIHEWIVLGCAQYCVWREVFIPEENSVSNRRVRPLRSRATHQAKLLANSGDNGS